MWPGRVRLDGLAYRVLTPHLPAEQRLPLLEREPDGGYLPQPYEQSTTAYRTVGDDAAARTVQLAKLRRHRRTLPAYARLWGHLPALKPSEAPAFNPLFSTLGLLLPIISLNRQ
ncbi:hypothetical protein ABZ800_08855 [Streptomyces sp. NPDC047813]|uniref:hypothetical protein n=1 Tax=Streptomyces sp. NPDC047813 TaxID=3154608 RepID=UPI0033C851ED